MLLNLTSCKRNFACPTLLIVLAGLSILAPGASQVLAIPASPHPFTAVQPDGTEITLHVRGDEYFHWFEDTNGYTVVRNAGAFEYAVLDGDGELAPSGLRVGQANPQTLQIAPGLLPTPAVLQAIRSSRLTLPALRNGPSMVPPSGTVKNLVVLCKFSDHVTGTHTRPQADYNVLFNAVGGDPVLAPTGSVRDLYLEDSYGTMTLDSTVVAWVTLPQTEAYYTNGDSGTSFAYPQNAQGMVEDALDLVDPMVDFGQFDTDNDGYIDAIDIIHSGYGAEFGGDPDKIWSHRWSLFFLPAGEWVSADLNGVGNSVRVYDYHTEPALWGTSGNDITRIGVIAHETGHFFGLPDFYDTDGSSEGIGSYGMMANSWGFDFTQYYPPHFCAFSKIFLGWVSPTTISAPGVYSAPQVETNPTVFRIDAGYPSGEYLLIENRQPVGHDAAMPQGGLCIWHIDTNKPDNNDEGYPGQSGWPANNNHYAVALLQADGNYDLERNVNRGDGGDVYHAGGVSRIDETTTPNTDSYQGGTISPTGNIIQNISAAGANMTFQFGDLIPCTSDPECDDGMYCNGVETCVGNFCQAGPGSPCGSGEACDEAGDTCIPVAFQEDFESGNVQGWTLAASDSTASTGDWVFGDPVGTYDGSNPAQPETAVVGSGCAFTGQNVPGSIGADDIDGGVIYLESPQIDLSEATTAELTFYRWFYNRDLGEDAGDFYVAQVRQSPGASWIDLENLGTNDQANAWTLRTFSLESYITLSSTVQLRFGASDGPATGNIIEAAIDDLWIVAGGCTIDGDCDDGVYCNGAEVCSAGTCESGTPVDCDDGVGCTDDSCNEGSDSCDNIANDANCENGLYCDGVEACDALLDCQPGTPVDCNDGVACTDDSCNEGTDSCDNSPNDALCDNGLYCDGAETCDVIAGCLAGSGSPCGAGAWCSENSDVCTSYGDGDFDGDSDIDLLDFQAFITCFGSAADIVPACGDANLIGLDGLIDLADYAEFATSMELSGPQ